MIYIALENIRSIHNVGAIFRTCAFFGFYNILLVGYTARDFKGINSVLHENVSRSSLGSEEHINYKFIDSTDALIDFAKENKLKIISLEQSPSATRLYEYSPLKKDVMYVFGNEVAGVSQKVIKHSDEVVEISRKGKYHSLNVATSVGVFLYHLSLK